MATILIVDDEPDVRSLLETIVSKQGHTVLTAADTGGAWGHLDENPAAIFIDIDMPGETGVEFVLRLRHHRTCSNIPVTFVTAYRERARPLVASGAGMVDIIDKPFRIETIQTKLDEMLAAQSV